MSKGIPIILIVVLAFCTRSPALELEYEGNFRYESKGYAINQDSYLNPDNDILNLPTSDSMIQLEFDLYSWLGGSLGFYLRDTVSYPIREDDSKIENTLNEAYLELSPSDSLFFTVGKQNITEGVGYAWNPTDFLAGLEEVNQADDTRKKREEREGVISLRGEYFLSRLTLTLVASPNMESWGQDVDPRAMVKVYTLIGDFDLSLIGYTREKKRPKFGLNVSGTMGESLEVHAEASLQRGSYRYYLSEVAPGHYEFIQKKKESEELYPKVLVGGQYTFSDNTNLVLEYYHNQEGYNSPEWSDYLEYLIFCGERYEDESLYRSYLLMGNAHFDLTSFRQNYLFLRFSKPSILDLFEVSSNNIYNLDDASLLMNVKVDYLGLADLSVYVLGNLFFGGPDSEFGMFHQSCSFGAGVGYFF